jgi:small subunit ribosomal protein S5
VRAVLELGGVKDVLTKSIGTQNPINLVKATMDGLIRLRRPEEVAELRGLTVAEVLGLSSNGSAAGPVAAGDADAARPAGPDAAGDPPPPAVAKASSEAVPPATPPAGEADAATAEEAPAAEAEAPASEADAQAAAEETKAEEAPDEEPKAEGDVS